MKNLFKKVILFTFIMLSLCFLFENPSFAKTSDAPAQSQVSQPDSSVSQSSLNQGEWNITSVPIRPLLPGSEWEVKSEENGNKLTIIHGGEEALTLVKE